jgi:aquaporin Z
MNPARSLAPALVSGNLHALWLYLLAPVLGTALGALSYQFIRGAPAKPAEIAEPAAELEPQRKRERIRA